MEKALVLGGNGKLGSHLTRTLADAGVQVRVFDRFSRPSIFDPDDRVEVMTGDFFDEESVKKALCGQDAVFHCLWATTPSSLDIDIAQDSELNLVPSVRMLQNAVDAGVSRAYFMSSGGAVYDPTFPVPYAENSPVRPISPYGVVKVATEGYFDYFEDRYGLDSTVFRVANLFGFPLNNPTQRGLVSVTLQRIQAGLPAVRFGDGTMQRDYIHVADVARLVGLVASTGHEYDVYNVGSGIGLSVNDMFDVIRNVTGVDFEIEERPVPASFPQSAVLDVSRFESEFGKPELTSITDGVATMWEKLQSMPTA